MDNEYKNRIDKLERALNDFTLHTHDGATSLVLVPKNLQGDYLFDSITVNTNGTTPINIFGGLSATTNVNKSPLNITIKAIYLISRDTTAGNIQVKNAGNSVISDNAGAGIAKGVVAGAMTGAVTLANVNVTITNTFTVVSSSAGNTQVIIIYKAN